MDLSVFYSWQSDSPAKGNRYLIRDALSEALKKINKDREIEESIRLDSDTAGVPGSPDITNTIFKKISETSLFVADLTLCFTGEMSRRSPNPNVLIELGYALSSIGDSRIVCVMNEAYGSASGLPFDLSHKRWPIRYSLSESDARDAEAIRRSKNEIVEQLATAIGTVMETSAPNAAKLGTLKPPSLGFIQDMIRYCDPSEDWERVSLDMSNIRVNKRDVNLRLAMHITSEGTQCENFTEAWANRHPDPNATGYWCEILYGSTLVARTILVSVDGARALLPVPRQRDSAGNISEILMYDYRIAQIFDTLGTLDEYIRRSNLSVAGKWEV